MRFFKPASRKGRGLTRFYGSAGFAACFGIFAICGFHSGAAAEELLLDVRETSGFARGGAPTAHKIVLPKAVPRTTPFSLHDDRGNSVIAQFSPANDDERQDNWWLDFSAALSPWQTRRYTVRYGPNVEAGSEGTGGHRLTQDEKLFQISNAPYITWKVPRDLAGLLTSVEFPPVEHLLPESPGLVLRDREGREHVLGAGFHAGRVLRSGRRAVALGFHGDAKNAALDGVHSTVELLFPSPVSWVEVDWTIDDPQSRVTGMCAALKLALDPPRSDAPTLVDFGAGTWVY
ncbi:MAG TPA: hypothetical protein VKU82_00970, partial [Planctomycetaceae bacterium]|nr:hypothetical protein [Planctomycetaceae bacterium]